MARKAKEVFSTSEIPHLWANQSHNKIHYGRNPQSNYSFRGPVIFSYAEPIGVIVKAKGGNVALFRDASWSNTTNRHQSDMRRAIGSPTVVARFSVPSIGQTRHGECKINHAENLDAYAAKILDAGRKAMKARNRRESYLAESVRLAESANAYAKAFGSRRTFKGFTADDMPAIKAATLAATEKEKRAELARVRKAEAARVAFQAAEAARKAKALAEVPQWIAGDVAEYPRSLSRHETGTDYMRIKGDNVETSQGAIVPLPHVARALRFVIPLMDAGRVWTSPPEKTFSIGHYALREVSPDSVVVGCHTFNGAEVRRIAVLIQAAGIVASDAAEA